ncbi:MAG: DUF4440 domain-containing protein [Micromonosporaceae bacterium]|nr:DUF4440 domain-containing protein [Micromonosporaceae bacterium]
MWVREDPLTRLVRRWSACWARRTGGSISATTRDRSVSVHWSPTDEEGTDVTDHATLREWLDRYEAAWRANDPAQIRALFTDDAVYRWHPWETGPDAAHGAEAIATAWLAEPDDPDSWQMRSEPLAVDGDLGVARCEIVYPATAEAPRRAYRNLFLIRLTADGRCRDFTEHYMREPA